MKILHLINYAGSGGSEKYIEILINDLLKRGDKVFFAFNNSGPLLDKLKKLDVTCFKIKMSSPFDIFASIKLNKICKKNKIDVIHTHFARENYIAILSKIFGSKCKVVYTSHINLQNNSFWKFTNYFFIKKNYAIIAVCNSVKQLLIKNNYPENKIHIIFNGVKYVESEPKILNNKDKIFVTLSRLSEEKGIEFLLETAKISNQNFKIKIAGDGEYRGKLEEHIQKNNLKNVELLGHISNVEEFLENADVYINCSSSEALSFGILEAMSFSLPIIATNVGGNTDIIKNAENGILVEFNNKEQLAKAMEDILKEDVYTVCSENSIKGVKNIFNIEETLKKTYDIYK
ncbi:MAG: glycosyltransferase family 4 protein [Defluviitaleaceae bacterium]|nr:glycosyltransferase family 4 protein [Defluviitaleaceae bacterium]